jgi:hypothetical protein
VSVEDAAVIDFVAYDPTGEFVLVMVEGREWDGSDERLLQLQRKINSYALFASDGQLLAKYPEAAGKSISLELRYVSPPDPKTARFLEMVREKLKQEGLAFRAKQIRSNPSG